MADLIDLTSGIISSAAAWQGLDQVVEVSGYDQLDIEAVLLTTTGSPTNAKIVIYTSMQRKPEASTSSDIPWQVLTTFTLTTPPEYSCTTAPIAGGQPLLRFIRWKLYFTGGSSPTATFQISILARRKSI